MKLILDFKSLDEKNLLKAFEEVFGVKGDLDRVLKEISKSFKLYVTALPLPEDKNLLRSMKGFRIDLDRSCDERVLKKIVEYFKPVESFNLSEVYDFGDFWLILDDSEDVVVLETNVDDVSGEIVSHAFNEVLKDAIDAYIFHCIGKKGRPCFMLKVLCEESKALGLAEKMCREIPTLGVRIYGVKRYKVKRRLVERVVNVFGKEFKLRVKVSEVSVKPEFEDVKRIAKDLNKPLPTVYLEILRRLKDEDFNWK